MNLTEFVSQIKDFDSFLPREKIRIFGWYLHTHQARILFDNEAIRNCYKELHLTPPDMSTYLPRLASLKPPDLLKERNGYKLERTIRTALDTKYGTHQSIVQVSKLLLDIPSRIPDLAEKTFLIETIKCYRVGAYRASIVMTWNLAFDHLLRWLLADAQRLADFNSAILRRYPKKSTLKILLQDHFEDLKEAEIIEICLTASLFSKNIIEILREKLKRRNIAAHPSQVIVTQAQADDVITDLVNNVVLILT
jgi:hypothetical protein